MSFRRALPYLLGGSCGALGLSLPLLATTRSQSTSSPPSDALPEQRTLTKVVCFMGSSVGNKPDYAEGAQALGQALADRGIGLVYGGGSRGLMGVIARTVADAGSSVVGYMPELLAPYEVGAERIGELHIVGTMHDRKASMAAKADAFIALPGGFGTLEELFEVLTWGMLGYHQKPIGLLNVGGFWDPLLAMVDHMVDEKFVQQKYRDMIIVESDANVLLDRLQSCTIPAPILTKTFGKLEAT